MYTQILITIVVIAIISLTTVQIISTRKMDILINKLLGNSPKPNGAGVGIPQYMQYEPTFKAFNNFITITFQRIYTTSVLPNLANSDRKIVRLAPNDKTYADTIQNVVLQVISGMPAYLYKSVLYYFGIVSTGNMNEDSKNPNYTTFTHFITSKAKGMLDSKIVDIGSDIEKNGVSADHLLNAYRDLGKFYGLTPENMKSPDGTKPQFIE